MEPETKTEREVAQKSEEAVFAARRSFLGVLIGLGTAAVGAVLAVPLVRFALYPLFARTTDTSLSDLGPADSFSTLSAPVQKIIQVSERDGWRELVSDKPVYVVKDAHGQIKVLSTVCPHLGCEVPWNTERQQFFCTCHGSVFAADGTRISGPTPRGLDSLPATVENGRLMVRYQYFRQLAPEKEVVG